MAALAAAVVLIGVLCLLDLLLTVGVIRRLREHTQLIAAGNGPGSAPPVPRPGAVVGEFTTVDTGGRTLARESLALGTLVGFFAPGCGPCTELIPRFVDHAAGLREGLEEAIAVVVAPAAEPEMIARLASVARVIHEPPNGPTALAFGVSGFPTLVLVGEGGTVASAGGSLEAVLPVVAGSR